MSTHHGKVHVVDDDDAVRKSLQMLFKTIDIDATAYESGDVFLEQFDDSVEGCILLDIRMPGMSGLEVQKQLHDRGNTMPIIFITGHGDVPMAVEAMQSGAFDFIQKPFRDQDLMDRVSQALSQSEQQREASEQKVEVAQRYESLTPREKEVMAEKMQARSLADLVRMSIQIEL
jgi:FixJ family two-component response regulator